MLLVSTAYEAAIGEDRRRFVPKVEITWTSPTIDASIDVTGTDENYISYPEQAADNITTPARKWAHLDGIMKADGTYYPAPSVAEAAAGIEMGYWSATRCGADRVFAAPPELTVEFSARPILGLLVAGDSAYGEYPTDFTIKIYDADDVLLHTETVVANADLEWQQAIGTEINDATYMVLRITKWSAANRVAKILEFYTSVIEVYTGDEVVSLNLLEEREIADGSLPIGNISANELDLALNNIAIVKNGSTIIDPFFPSNPNTYLQNVLKRNRKIRAWLGLVLQDTTVEYIPLGTFWSGDWSAEEQESTVSTSARDRMELLRNAVCSTLPVYESTTLYTLAEALLTNARINIPMPDLYWEIDTALQGFTVPYGYFPRQDYFACIKQLVTACMGQAYMSRDDVLIITGPGNYTRPGA